MLRTYLIIGVILFILGVGGYWHNQYIQSSAYTIDEKLIDVETLVQNNNWNHAGEEIAMVMLQWDKTRKFWSLLIDHQEIDNIDLSLKRVEQYIIESERGLSLGELAALRLLINHIADNEKISIQNIL